jgi:hypothetical protein
VTGDEIGSKARNPARQRADEPQRYAEFVYKSVLMFAKLD